MLFLTRVDKFGMTSLLGLVLGIVMFLSGHTWIPIVVYTLCGLMADVVLKIGDYSLLKIQLSVMDFSHWEYLVICYRFTF